MTSYSFVAIFQQHQPLEVTFQNSNDILELVSGILIFSTDLSCLHRSYAEKTTLLLGWRHRYEMSVTLHYDLIVRSSISISHMAMYLIPFTQLVCFLFHLQNLYRPRLWVIWRVSYKKLELSTWRAPRILHFWWVCVSHLLVFCDMFCFFFLRSVPWSLCCQCLSIVQLFFSLLFIYLSYLTLIFYCICDILCPLLMKTGSVFLRDSAGFFCLFLFWNEFVTDNID